VESDLNIDGVSTGPNGMRYYFEVTPPTVQQVNVTVSYALFAFATYDYTDLGLNNSGFPNAFASISYGEEYTGNNTRGFSATINSVFVDPRDYGSATSATQTLGSNSNPAASDLQLVTNQIYYIELTASAAGTVPGAQGIAIADPSINIDPGQSPTDALILSGGIQNEVNAPPISPMLSNEIN
jgi:hypothetical protein